jgi:spermidine/putrescine transport system permease protein
MIKQVRNYLGLIGLLAPTYLWLVVGIFVPLIIMLVFSFLTDVPIGTRTAEFTIENYTKFLSRPFYLTLSLKSVWMGAVTTILSIICGYPAAYAMSKVVNGKWKSALFMLVIIPFWSSAVVRAYSWIIVLRDNGVIYHVLQSMNIPVESLSVLFTFKGVILGLVHAYLPYVILTTYVALDRIDDTLLEAAQSLGAGSILSFLRVTLPLSLPGVLAGAILTFIPATGSFMEPRVLGGTSGTVIGSIIEDQFVTVFNWPFGAALAFILLVSIILILVPLALVLKAMQILPTDGK